ncbi:MAG: phosphodiester glycosidase family protein, partial [Ruminococcaceae bacterium]|nr:phosphodiester glycosidase family protein [Oscillospiraceae bacterium]
MKRFFGLAIVLVLLYAMLLTVIPASAITAGPFTYEKGVIQNISSPSSKSLGNGKANYYKTTITSRMHNKSNKESSYETHVVIGGKDAKFFVYSGESSDKMGYKKMSVHDMVVEFEKANPAWQVVAAVNGDFFNTTTGEPESPMIQQGDMLKAYKLNDMTGRGIVGIDDTTGKAVYHTVGSAYSNAKYGTSFTYKSQYQVQVLGSHKTNAIASYDSLLINTPTSNQLSFITPDCNRNANYTGKTVYVVSLERYRNDTGSHNGNKRTSDYYYAYGKITKTITGTKDMKPSKGEVYIAAMSSTQAPLLKVGTYVKVQKQLVGVWQNVSNAIGFKQQLLAEGNVLFTNTYSRYH